MKTDPERQTELPQALQRCIVARCGASYAIDERIYVCRRCDGPLEIELHFQKTNDRELKARWKSRASSIEPRDQSGVWRYREFLPTQDPAAIVTLFEGNTPVYEAPRCADYCGLTALRLKHQGCNPTGSFKDTGMTVAVTQAKSLGVRTVICASTGNTAASMAAYAARAGMSAAILIPRGQIAAAKLAQSMDYGARILEIEGNFDAAMKLICELMGDPSIYVANSVNPFRIEGQKTVAFEMLAQFDWRVPDHVVVPGGNLGNSAALAKGFQELLDAGLIERLPKLSVVQAEGAAPLAALFQKLGTRTRDDDEDLSEEISPVLQPRTLATAIRIGSPVSWRKSLRGVLRSGGRVIAVSEAEIADAKALIGRDGIGCEPASATTAAGIKKMVASGHVARHEFVVGILTGNMMKDPDYASRYHTNALALGESGGGKHSQRIEGKFRNPPELVPASTAAILEALQRDSRA